MNSGRYKHINDSDLLEYYYSDKDQQWIGILLERYTLLLLGVCMKYLKNEDDAKDSVQQVFLKVLTEMPKFKVEYFKSWLYMVTKNHCLMKLREKKGKEIKELKDQFYESPETNKIELDENEKAYTLLEESINELTEEQKQCVTLFYLHKNSYNQITEKTGYSLMQVKSYIQNGKRNLRNMLEKKLTDPKK